MYTICKLNGITCVNQSKCAVMKCFILAEFHNMKIHVQGSTFQSVQSLTLSHDEGIDGRKGIILKSGRNQVSRKPAFVWICIWSNLCLAQRPLQVKLLQHGWLKESAAPLAGLSWCVARAAKVTDRAKLFQTRINLPDDILQRLIRILDMYDDKF